MKTINEIACLGRLGLGGSPPLSLGGGRLGLGLPLRGGRRGGRGGHDLAAVRVLVAVLAALVVAVGEHRGRGRSRSLVTKTHAQHNHTTPPVGKRRREAVK